MSSATPIILGSPGHSALSRLDVAFGVAAGLYQNLGADLLEDTLGVGHLFYLFGFFHRAAVGDVRPAQATQTSAAATADTEAIKKAVKQIKRTIISPFLIDWLLVTHDGAKR